MSDHGASLPPPSPPPPPTDAAAGGRPWWQQWYTIVGAVVVLLLVVAGLIIVGGSDDESSDGSPAPTTGDATDTTSPPETSEPPSSTEAPRTPATTSAPTTEPPATTASPTTDPPPTDGEPTCRYLGTDFADDMQVELSFTNTLGDQPSLEVAYALFDADDVRFLTESAFVELAAADERFRLSDDTFSQVPPGVDETTIGCAVLEIAEGFSGRDVSAPGADDVCEVVEIDDFDDIQIRLTITSPFTDTTDVQIYYALRGPDRARFDGSSAFVDLVAPGEAIRTDEDTVTEVPDWTTSEEVTCDVLGIERTDF